MCIRDRIGEVEQRLTDHVGIDSVAGAVEITRHVIERGARRIAVIGGDDQHAIATATSRLRLQGVRRALAEAGLAADPVSYTHLDVYKRQVSPWTGIEIFMVPSSDSQ